MIKESALFRCFIIFLLLYFLEGSLQAASEPPAFKPIALKHNFNYVDEPVEPAQYKDA